MTAGQDMWSRRREAVKAETEALERAQEAAIVAHERAELEEKSDAEILQELDLRDPGEMQAGDDFSGFMKSVVPDRLRKRALRKLWLTSPLLASVDELVDYGEDFTDAGTVVEGLQTAYQVGKGMLGHVQAVEKEKAEALIAAPGDDNPPEQKVALQNTAPAMHAEDGGLDGAKGLEAENREDETVEGVAHEPPAALPVTDDAPDGVPDDAPDDAPGGVVRRKMQFVFAD